MDIFEISAIWNDTDATINFLQERNIIKRRMLCCGQEAGLVRSKSRDGREFKCSICTHRYSLRTGSFFFGSKLKLTILLSLLYFFCNNFSIRETCRMVKKRVSKPTIIQWFVYFRDICSKALLDSCTKLGGPPGNSVEIDECCIGRKRKFNRGYHRGGGNKWIFGILDVTTKKCHIEYVQNRTCPTLFEIIKRQVIQGTVISTDEAPVYATLPQEGFGHKTVCHQENYVNPVDGTTTNHIENFWSHLKIYVQSIYGIDTANLPLHLDEYMYKWNRKLDGCFFDIFVADIAHYYPV